jgi:hypothetical protein
MTLNGHTYDTMLAEVHNCRATMQEIRGSRPDAETFISRSSDRGMVGALISHIEKGIIAKVEPELFIEEWGDDTRGARLWIISKLCDREISTVWDLMFYELRGILDWAVANDGTRWILQAGPARVMKALILDGEFTLLVESLPKEGDDVPEGA